MTCQATIMLPSECPLDAKGLKAACEQGVDPLVAAYGNMRSATLTCCDLDPRFSARLVCTSYFAIADATGAARCWCPTCSC